MEYKAKIPVNDFLPGTVRMCFWEKCSDRMPKENGAYIVCDTVGSVWMCDYVQEPMDEPDEHWRDMYNCWQPPEHEIVYWMDLPDPPNQKGE